MLALPPGSPIRERVAKRMLARAFEALAREDYEVILLTYDPDAEITIIGDEGMAVGFAEHYRGHQGYRDMMRTWRAVWVSPRFTPEALIDFGDRFAVRITLTGQGASSGAEVAQTSGYVLHFADGVIVRMDIYWDWSACAEALGLHDHALADLGLAQGGDAPGEDRGLATTAAARALASPGGSSTA
jgi:ketosteroid isomerase-like protein